MKTNLPCGVDPKGHATLAREAHKAFLRLASLHADDVVSRAVLTACDTPGADDSGGFAAQRIFWDAASSALAMAIDAEVKM